MTAPIYVGTRWDLDRFDPGPGLPVLTRSPSLVTVQDTLDAILVAAGKANIELRFSATGDPGNAPTDPYVTESELHAQLGTTVAGLGPGGSAGNIGTAQGDGRYDALGAASAAQAAAVAASVPKPASTVAGVLTNDGAGGLTWAPLSGGAAVGAADL